MPAPANFRGFTITDLTATIALLAIAAALALAATRQMRHEAMTAAGLNQLRWIAGATSSYAADNGDRFWTFSWQAGHTGSSYPDLRNPRTDRYAIMYQATDILRRRVIPEMPVVGPWVSNILYNHLPLIEYLDTDMPDFNLIAPHDRHRLAWARDPDAFDRGEFLPYQPEPTIPHRRWIYSSSYELPPAFFDQSSVAWRLYPVSSHHFSPFDQSMMSAHTVADAAFPSQKVHVFDRAGLGPGGEQQFALFASSRTPALMVDGAAAILTTGQTNQGWVPNAPSSIAPSRFQHEPYPWEHGPSGIAAGHYRWTRGGIEGRDVGGPEIDTGQL